MDSYLSVVRCPDKDGYLLPDHPLEKGSGWRCDRCGKPVSEEWVDQQTSRIKEIGSKINLTADLRQWEDYLNLAVNELHPSNTNDMKPTFKSVFNTNNDLFQITTLP